MAGLIDWGKQDFFTIRQASCLLTGDYPYYDDDRFLTSEATQTATALRCAISSKQLPIVELWVQLPIMGSPNLIHECPLPSGAIGNGTIINRDALQEWCAANGAHWPFPYSGPPAATSTPSGSGYPDELRAAIEAFEVVHGDPATTAKRSPKAALTAWLEANKPELSANARERIATVANWQPTGGAPKTSGE